MSRNERAMEDAALKLVANAYVEKEGEKIIEEAKRLNQESKVPDEEVAEFENYCGKEFAKQEWRKRLKDIGKVAVAAIAVFIFVSGIHQFNFSYNNPVVDEKGTTTTTKKYSGDKEKKFAPTYIPESYNETTINFINENELKINYYASEEKFFVFYYKLAKEKHSKEINGSEKLVDINGSEAKVTSKPSESIVKIVWEKGNHIFCIDAQGVDEEEVIKVAKSVKSVKED